MLHITRKYDHITPTLIKLHWLPIQQRIKFNVLLLVYKGLNGLVPSNISSLLLSRTCTRSLRSSDKELLQVPKSRLKTYGDRRFSVAAQGARLFVVSFHFSLFIYANNTLYYVFIGIPVV